MTFLCQSWKLSMLCLTFWQLLAQLVWNSNVLLWSLFFWARGTVQSRQPKMAQPSHTTLILYNTRRSLLRKGPVFRAVLTLRKKAFTVLVYVLPMKYINGNLITCCCGERKSNLKTDWPFSLPLPSLPFPASTFQLFNLYLTCHVIFSEKCTINPYIPHIWKQASVFLCKYCMCPWVGFAVDITDWQALRQTPLCIFNKSETIQACFWCVRCLAVCF